MKPELRRLGLSEKEIELYLICIKTGESTANRIAELARLARSTTYDVLEKLRHKGFITTFVKDKKTYFLANNPEVILTSIEEKKKSKIKEFEDQESALQGIIPELKLMQHQINKKPVAEVFEGKVSISRVLDEIVENAEYIKIMGNQENAIKKIDYRTDRFRMKRKERDVKVYQLLEDSPEARREKIDKFTKVRFIKSISKSKDAIFIYNDTTVHLILAEEISAIRIKSKEYTQAQEICFDELWSVAKQK
ncbi:MAG: TrmB family transcriptional regulator [Candidatus Nanoarchaeia archaeon]